MPARLQSSIGFQPVGGTRRMRMLPRPAAHFERNDITITHETAQLGATPENQ